MIGAVQLIFVTSEAIRKFLFNELIVLASFDLVILWMLLKFSSIEYRRAFFAISALLLCHTLIFSLVYEFSPLTYLAGLRPVVFVFGGIVLAKYHFERRSGVTVVILSLTALAITIFAMLQVHLGPEHPINSTPMNLTLSKGLGGYSYEVERLLRQSIPILIRPAAVFITTGKFGTYVAGLTLIIVSLLLTTKHSFSATSIALVFFVLIAANLVAMQRAFWYPFMLSSIVFFFAFKLQREQIYKSLLILVPLVAIGTTMFFDGFLVITDRLSQFPSEIVERVSEFSRMLPMSLENVFFGRGFGFFSNYAHLVGGSNYMDFYWNTGEGQYHILIAEFGVLACVIAACFAVLFIISETINAISSRGKLRGQLNFVRATTAFLILLWGSTHTIYASAFFVMSFSFSLTILYFKIRSLETAENHSPRGSVD